MPGGTLLLKLRENTRVVGSYPFRCHKAHYPVAVAFAFPEWDYLIPVNGFDLIIDLKTDFGPRVKDLEILKRMKAYLGIGGGGFWRRTPLSHYEFTVVNANLLVFQDVLKCKRPSDRG